MVWNKQKKETWFSLNGNGIRSSFLGRQFYRSTLYIYTRMLRAILTKSWRQHPTKHQLYGHLPPITKTIKLKRTIYAGHCWRSKDELKNNILQWNPSHGRAKAERPARTNIHSFAKIRDVVLRTCQKRWTIGRSD